MKAQANLLFAVSLTLLAVGAATSHAGQTKKQHNILFLFADDQRKDTIAALGNPHIQTPNLDKLVKRSTVFTRAYIQGATVGAVCMPSRAMLMTGRTLFRAPLSMQGVPLLGEILQQAGYVSCGIGKWHNGGESLLRSFQIAPASYMGGMSDHFNVPLTRIKGRQLEKYENKGKHSSEIYADAAIDFLTDKAAKKQRAGKPFFLYVAFQAPHDPRDAPKKYLDMYYKARPPLPKNFLPQHPFHNGDMVMRDENLAPWPRTELVLRDQLAEYYALMTHLDEQVGRILQALAESGELENTIIIYCADNGLALGSHGLMGKQNLYDHSVSVPLMIAGPGIPQDEKRDAMVYNYDLFPTLCDLNGIAIPDTVEGKSLKKVISGEETKVRDDLYFNYRNLMRGMRDEQWKLICYPKIGHVQLFDLKNDPYEMKNMAEDPDQAKRVAQMKERILVWEKDLGLEPALLAVPNPMPKEINLTGTARQPDQWQPLWIRQKYFGKD